jgi:integrase
MPSKQAKILTPREISQVLDVVAKKQYPKRNKVIVLLSFKAGLRVKEIASITWSMVTNASGQISDCIQMPDSATKGKSGRTIPLNAELKQALVELWQERQPRPDQNIVFSQRATGFYPRTLTDWFAEVFKTLRLDGCSSHSGRRTFVTSLAKRAVEAGGSLRDVQQLAGHSSLSMTQSYIEGNNEAKQKMVNLI